MPLITSFSDLEEPPVYIPMFSIEKVEIRMFRKDAVYPIRVQDVHMWRLDDRRGFHYNLTMPPGHSCIQDLPEFEDPLEGFSFIEKEWPHLAP